MKKIKQIIALSLCFCLCLLLVGCDNSNIKQEAIANKLESSLSTISNTIKKVDIISDADLMIAEIMDNEEVAMLTAVSNKKMNSQRQIVRYKDDNNGYNGATFTNAYPVRANSRYVNSSNYNFNQLGSYVTKIERLHNSATDSLTANNQITYLRSEILSKVNALQSIVKDIKSNNIEINANQKKTIEDLINNLNINVSRVNLSKNEVKNELKNVKSLKSNYANNVEQLNAKYTRLINCLDTRQSYYSNILNNLDGIYDCIINGNCDTNSLLELFNKYNQNNSTCDDGTCNDGTCIDGNCDTNNPCSDLGYCPQNGCYYDKSGNCYDKDGNCIDCVDKNTCRDKNCKEITENTIDVANASNKYNNQYMDGVNNYDYNNNFNNYGYNNGYNNGFGYYADRFQYPRNVNTFQSYRNTNTYGDNMFNQTRKNIDEYKNVNMNIDSYRKRDKNNQNNQAKNINDPYKVMPKTEINDNNINIEEQTKTLEHDEVYYGTNPYGTHGGYFKIYRKSNMPKPIENVINEDNSIDNQEQIKQDEIKDTEIEKQETDNIRNKKTA